MQTNQRTPLHPFSPMADLLCTVMVLTRGKLESGADFWAYMCIKPSMAHAFKEARDAGGFNLEDYGTIIEWGEGAEPPADIQTRMERDYGMRHDYEQQLLAAIDKHEVK